MQLHERHGKYSAECYYVDPATGRRKRILRATGIRVDGTEETKRTAEHAGRALEAELNGAKGVSKARRSRGKGALTLRLAFASATQAAALGGSSQESIDADIRSSPHVLRFFGPECNPWDIDDDALERYALKAAQRRKASTIRRELAALFNALKAAKVKPLPKAPKIAQTRPRELAFDGAQLRRLFDAVPTGRGWSKLWPTRRDYLRVYAGLGLSYKELYGIAESGIDWAQHTVRVRGTKRESRDRTVPMSKHVAAVLRRALELMRVRGDGVLFPKWCNIRLNDVLSIAARGQKLVPAKGRVSINVLRASFCTELVRQNVHPKKIALLMGHKTTATAERWYMRLRPEKDLHDAVANLPEL